MQLFSKNEPISYFIFLANFYMPWKIIPMYNVFAFVSWHILFYSILYSYFCQYKIFYVQIVIFDRFDICIEYFSNFAVLNSSCYTIFWGHFDFRNRFRKWNYPHKRNKLQPKSKKYEINLLVFDQRYAIRLTLACEYMCVTGVDS